MLSDEKTSLSAAELSVPSALTETERSEEGATLKELFGDIDWQHANLGELEQQWRAELASIEQVPSACVDGCR